MSTRQPIAVALHVRESRLTPSSSSKDDPNSTSSTASPANGWNAASSSSSSSASTSRQTVLRGSIEEKKEAEKRTEAWQDWLMEQEEPVTIEEMKVASLYLQPEHFAEVVHERHLANRCGYPPCARPSRAPFRSFDDERSTASSSTSNPSSYDMPTTSSRSRYALDTITRTFRRLVGGNHRQAYCSMPCEARARWYTLQLDSQAGGRSEPLRWRVWWLGGGGPGESGGGREMNRRSDWDPETARKSGWVVSDQSKAPSKKPVSKTNAIASPSRIAEDRSASGSSTAAKLQWLQRTHGRFAKWQAELLEELEARGEVHVDIKSGEVRPGSGGGWVKNKQDVGKELKASDPASRSRLVIRQRETRAQMEEQSAEGPTQEITDTAIAASPAPRKTRPAAKLATSEIIQGEAGSFVRGKRGTMSTVSKVNDPKVLAATLSSLKIVERPPTATAKQEPQPPNLLTSKALQDPVAAKVAMQPAVARAPTPTMPAATTPASRRQSSHALAAREDARRRYFASAGAPAGNLDGDDDLVGASAGNVSRQVVQASTRAAAQAPITQPSTDRGSDESTDEDEEDDSESDEELRAAFEMATIARQQLKDGTFE